MTTQAGEDEFRSRLASEVADWERDGLVSAEQAGRILARYRLQRSAARAFRLGPVATFVSVLGAVVLGVGVIIFFAANWERMPDALKLLLVFVSMTAAYVGGYALRYRSDVLPRVGDALILLGALLFQAGVFLIAQIYNLPVDSPLALLVGAVGILPLAYALRSRLVLVLGLADGLAWIGWTLQQRYPDMPESYAVPLMYLLVGVLIYVAGHLHLLARLEARFVPVFQVFGLVTVLLPAFFLSFTGVWDGIDANRWPTVPWWFALALLLALAGAAGLLFDRGADPAGPRRRDIVARVEAAAFALVALSVAVVAYVPAGLDGYAFLFNVLFFGLVALACVRGYLEGEARFVNVGIPFLAVGLLSRYFDLFWGSLETSLFWIVGGVILLALAAGLERLRRRLLAGFDDGGQPAGGAAAGAQP